MIYLCVLQFKIVAWYMKTKYCLIVPYFGRRIRKVYGLTLHTPSFIKSEYCRIQNTHHWLCFQKLTKASPPDRDACLQEYIHNDLLGDYRGQQQSKPQSLLGMLSSDSPLVKEYTARLFNAFASLSDGELKKRTRSKFVIQVRIMMWFEPCQAIVFPLIHKKSKQLLK